MKTSDKILMTMRVMVDDSEEVIKNNPSLGKLVATVGTASLMARSRGGSHDEDTALAGAINILSCHDDIAIIRLDLTDELERVAENVAPAVTHPELNLIRLLATGIHLIDMVGQLMVSEQEKEQCQ